MIGKLDIFIIIVFLITILSLLFLKNINVKRDFFNNILPGSERTGDIIPRLNEENKQEIPKILSEGQSEDKSEIKLKNNSKVISEIKTEENSENKPKINLEQKDLMKNVIQEGNFYCVRKEVFEKDDIMRNKLTTLILNKKEDTEKKNLKVFPISCDSKSQEEISNENYYRTNYKYYVANLEDKYLKGYNLDVYSNGASIGDIGRINLDNNKNKIPVASFTK